MSSRASLWISLLVCGVGLGVLQAAALSEQQADSFSRKMAIVTQQGGETSTKGAAQGLRRTSFSEAELNSWFTYRSQEVLPPGVSEPRVTIVGDGKLKAAATVDLETIAKQRSSGGALNPWTYLGGRLPVTVSGVLRTQDGMGRFDLEEAAVSGVPIPKSIMQEIVSYYSKTDETPAGVRLDDGFKLPAKIKQIEVGQGQAVVVQ
jgi:hypothetical protein